MNALIVIVKGWYEKRRNESGRNCGIELSGLSNRWHILRNLEMSRKCYVLRSAACIFQKGNKCQAKYQCIHNKRPPKPLVPTYSFMPLNETPNCPNGCGNKNVAVVVAQDKVIYWRGERLVKNRYLCLTCNRLFLEAVKTWLSNFWHSCLYIYK